MYFISRLAFLKALTRILFQRPRCSVQSHKYLIKESIPLHLISLGRLFLIYFRNYPRWKLRFHSSALFQRLLKDSDTREMAFIHVLVLWKLCQRESYVIFARAPSIEALSGKVSMNRRQLCLFSLQHEYQNQTVYIAPCMCMESMLPND